MSENKKIDSILTNLSKLNNDNFNFRFISSWIFPDGYIFEIPLSNKLSSLVLLNVNNNPTGLLYFNVTNHKINISFIQGIPQKNKIETKKLWIEILMDSFLLSSAHLLKEKNFKLEIDFFKENNRRSDGREKLIKKTKESKEMINSLKEQLEKIEETIRLQKKRNIESFSTIRRFNILTREIDQLTIEYKTNEFILKLYGSIRDRYFDKNGNLNFKKERVKKIFKAYETLKKKKQVFRRISSFKERVKKIKIRKK